MNRVEALGWAVLITVLLCIGAGLMWSACPDMDKWRRQQGEQNVR